MPLTREGLIEIFSDPSLYPHRVKRIETRETHISLVFLTGNYVYKIKKPVDFGFLNFTTLEKRKYFCEQEIKLNRRLTNDVYLDLLALTQKDSSFTLEPAGEAVEYVIKMRQLSDSDTLMSLLQGRNITERHIERLASKLAAFYHSAEKSSVIDQFGSTETILTNTEENFSQTEVFVPEIIPLDMFASIRDSTRRFLETREKLFAKRIADGWIRDCHGDLRCEHVYFERQGIQILDCIEFNDRFRYSDVAADLAFLLMDLDFNGFRNEGHQLLSFYVKAANDPTSVTVLDFYKCYRAYVRVKVNCLQMTTTGLSDEQRDRLKRDAKRYLELSFSAAREFQRPILWLICGLPASGKSRMAMVISLAYHVSLYSSDIVRKNIFGIAPDQRVDEDFGKGIYSAEASRKTYAEMLSRAEKELLGGNGAVLDATFGNRKTRIAAKMLAEKYQANFVIVYCKPPIETIERRLKARETKKTVSDARIKHLDGHVKAFEVLNEEEIKRAVVLDTQENFEKNVQRVFIESYLKAHAL